MGIRVRTSPSPSTPTRPRQAGSALASLLAAPALPWKAILVVALATPLLIVLAVMRLPEPGLMGDAGSLCASTTGLAWALSSADGTEAAQLRQRVAEDLARLNLSAARNTLDIPDLPAFSARWAALPPVPSVPAARGLADAADRLAMSVQEAMRSRQAATERGLLGLAGASLLALALPLVLLQQRRRRTRSTLRTVAGNLQRGDWRAAAHQLRNTPESRDSAFDVLASGVENVLGESERRWRTLADLSADWYWETDAQHRFRWMSPASPLAGLPSWMGRELGGSQATSPGLFEPPPAGWGRLMEHLHRHEAFHDVEFRTRQGADGQAMWVSISGRPRHDASGAFIGYEGVGHDITERKTAHERLVASEQRWSLMAGLASDWYWQTDAQHRVLPPAPEIRRRLPDLAALAEGRTRWEADPNALTAELWAEHQADLAAHRPFRGLQYEVDVGDGRFLWISLSGIPRFDGQGRFIGYHGVGRDITVRKQAERLLMRHNEELQRAVAERTQQLEHINRDLDAFARQLAHELRTPIAQVEGLTHLIECHLGDGRDLEVSQLLDLQRHATRGMRETLDALMQLARSTVQALAVEVVDVSAIATQAVADLPALARQAPVDWQIEPGLQARAGAAALRIVFVNLLGNAAKFTRQSPQPLVQVSGSLDAEGRLRVRVQDNGVGFEPALASRLFAPFSRLHAGEEFHGTGIGLSIVQRIVERHGGTVRAEGEPGRGATFEFTLAAP